MSEACPFGDQKIEFPVQVHFRIIARAELKVDQEVKKTAARLGLGDMLSPGNRSAAGTYRTWNLSVLVDTQARMSEIDRVFRTVEGVKMVL